MDVGLDPDAYWAELLAMGASDDEADAARSELVRQRQEAAKLSNADERDARIDELCKIDGPLSRDEADELNRLAAERRREQRWSD